MEEEEDGRPRLGTGPRARWAELAAGNWPSVGGRAGAESRGGGGGIMDEADAEDDVEAVGRGGGGIDSVEREKVGGGSGMLATGCMAFAFGVVGDSGSSSCPTAMKGSCPMVSVGIGGGGGAARSASWGSTMVGAAGASGGGRVGGVRFDWSCSSRRRASDIVAGLRRSHERSVDGSHDGGRMMT